jgi:putative flippase GtrA
LKSRFHSLSFLKKNSTEKAERNNVIQFVKYIFVGGTNFFFGIAVFYLLVHIFNLNYLVAFTITWILGVLLTYTINFVWVFKPEEKFNFKSRLFKYVTIYLLSYLVNILLLKIITEKIGYDPVFVQFGLIPIVIGINFLGMKYWSLK